MDKGVRTSASSRTRVWACVSERTACDVRRAVNREMAWGRWMRARSRSHVRAVCRFVEVRAASRVEVARERGADGAQAHGRWQETGADGLPRQRRGASETSAVYYCSLAVNMSDVRAEAERECPSSRVGGDGMRCVCLRAVRKALTLHCVDERGAQVVVLGAWWLHCCIAGPARAFPLAGWQTAFRVADSVDTSAYGCGRCRIMARERAWCRPLGGGHLMCPPNPSS
ncbi:hypothetical protein B0H16DRAFT_1475765 [Mycena metata]|uniref:Uncharacterized protein n=1 Tax=Mycena metata TaxID=1033252 RepID=A0AAD7HDK5_9AGAR|nr:hypothetical protein B0H16DRAFT_1475765 [Mycena metata]